MSGRFIVVVCFVLILAGATVDMILSREKNSDAYQEINSLETERIYCMYDSTGEAADYVRVVENNKEDQKITVQFMVKKWGATKVEQPLFSYDELIMIVRSNKLYLIQNNDLTVERIFRMKNR